MGKDNLAGKTANCCSDNCGCSYRYFVYTLYIRIGQNLPLDNQCTEITINRKYKEQFAKLIGISGQYLGTVESGINGLSLNTIINICEKTNTSADYLLFGKNFNNSSLNNLFENISPNQIESAFDSLQNIAMYIKSNEIKMS